MPTTLSIITYCKGRLHELKRWLPAAVDALDDDDEIIVVDYDDPDDAHLWLRAQPFPQLVTVHLANLQWFHADHARNCGLRQARNDIVIFADVDFLITQQIVAEIRTNDYKAFGQQPDDVGSLGFIYLRREHAMALNGWEEAVCGYGWDDIDFKHHCRLYGLRPYTMTNRLISIRSEHQVRILEGVNKARNATVNQRILRALASLHPYKNNVGRNWGWGGETYRMKPCSTESSKCDHPATCETASSSL